MKPPRVIATLCVIVMSGCGAGSPPTGNQLPAGGGHEALFTTFDGWVVMAKEVVIGTLLDVPVGEPFESRVGNLRELRIRVDEVIKGRYLVGEELTALHTDLNPRGRLTVEHIGTQHLFVGSDVVDVRSADGSRVYYPIAFSFAPQASYRRIEVADGADLAVRHLSPVKVSSRYTLRQGRGHGDLLDLFRTGATLRPVEVMTWSDLMLRARNPQPDSTMALGREELVGPAPVIIPEDPDSNLQEENERYGDEPNEGPGPGDDPLNTGQY